MYKNLLVEDEQEVRKIFINRNEKRNAVNTATKKEITAAMNEAASDEKVKAVVLGAVGDGAFCSGQDLDEGSEADTDGAAMAAVYGNLFASFRNFSKPVIGAINGPAMGSGFQLVLLPDYTIVSDTARFGMTEIVVGFPCIYGSMFLWNSTLGAKAKELVLSGKMITAAEALALGLISEVVPQKNVGPLAMKTAHQWAQKPPTVFKWMKNMFSLLTEDRLKFTSEYAKKAYTEAYKANEPQIYMKKFLEERRAAKAAQGKK
jgi:enoyl-CoA hydratase/carnithine racemase